MWNPRFLLGLMVMFFALACGSAVRAATVYDNFGNGFSFDATAGWNISGPDVFVPTPVTQGEQFVAAASGILSEFWIAGGWGRPYTANPVLPGFELTANLALVNPDGTFNPTAGIGIQISPAAVQDWIAGGLVHVSGLEAAGFSLQSGQLYDFWLAVSGDNYFTWSRNSTGAVGARLFATDYTNPGLSYGNDVRGAFRIDVVSVPEPGTLFLLIAGLGLMGVASMSIGGRAGLPCGDERARS